METAKQFIGELAEHVSMPAIYLKIRDLIKQPDTSIDDYVKLVNDDSMLANRILRIANSEFFGFSRKATNLTQALNLIGIIQLHDLLLCSLCMRTFSSLPSQIINLKAFWLYSTQCGIAARVIAQHCFTPISNHYFTLGLMHEIGHAAMYIKFPDECLQILDENQTKGTPVQQLEQEHLGFDYGQVGTLLMQLWHLPEAYQQVASYHLQPEMAGTGCSFEVQVIHLAHTLCQNPVPGEHKELIKNIRHTNPQLKNLPDNIDSIIVKEIEAHSVPVLKILWPNSENIMSEEDGPLKHE